MSVECVFTRTLLPGSAAPSAAAAAPAPAAPGASPAATAGDRNRESIMIGPSKSNTIGITFILFAHTNREHGLTLAQECGKPLSFL